MLTHTAYGKSRVRLVQVLRRGDRHDVRDLAIAIRFEGDYDASYTDGDNRDVLPTDTMKNTVYALAGQQPVREPESFALRLTEHFLARNSHLRRVVVEATDYPWQRVEIGEREHGRSFVRRGPETRVAVVTADRDAAVVESGIEDLLIMKTADSAFSDFMHDEFTTLPDTRDRLLATALSARWRYYEPDVPYGPTWRGVRDALLRSFAEHRSESVQHTMHAMGQEVLDNVDVVQSITLVMPNKHHLPVDLSPFGGENRNEIFVATEEPFGRIEATLSR